jgi:hypothetical protein
LRAARLQPAVPLVPGDGTAEKSFDHSSFTSNRKRLLEHEAAGEFFRGVLEEARALKLLSNEHFTVDGTLIQAWASLKSFKRQGAESCQGSDDDPGNPSVNFHGERRSNATHKSTTDPQALLARKGKGKEAKLCYSANALAENRNSLLLDLQVEPADGSAERRAAVAMADERQVAVALRWARTRATTPAPSSPGVGNSRSRPT